MQIKEIYENANAYLKGHFLEAKSFEEFEDLRKSKIIIKGNLRILKT